MLPFLKSCPTPKQNPFYPLELDSNWHVCLWSADGKYKWTIGMFRNLNHEEGPDFCFVGERPFDARVDWEKFKRLIEIGYKEIEAMNSAD